jgi:hypothetical protein
MSLMRATVNGLSHKESRHKSRVVTIYIWEPNVQRTRGARAIPRTLPTHLGCKGSIPSISSHPLTKHNKREGASVEGIHRSYDLGRMFSMGGPSEAGAPSVHDLEERSVDEESEGRGLGEGRSPLVESSPGSWQISSGLL